MDQLPAYNGEDTLPEGYHEASDAARAEYWTSRARYQLERSDRRIRAAKYRKLARDRAWDKTMREIHANNEALTRCRHQSKPELVVIDTDQTGSGRVLDGEVIERCRDCKKTLRVAA